MAPRHAKERIEALHEPTRAIESQPWESGAEDARTPNADASSAALAGAKRLECVRFIGAFRPARHGQRFMAPMHAKKRKGALHEHGRVIPAYCRQRNTRAALPTRRRQHPVGGTIRLV